VLGAIVTKMGAAGLPEDEELLLKSVVLDPIETYVTSVRFFNTQG